MNYRQLGKSGLHVSEISLGTWVTIGGQLSEKESFELFDSAIEHGVNLIDTADIYLRGEAESILGKYLQTTKREELIIATKVFGAMSESPMMQGLSHRYVMNACEASLKRLNIDYIDLYQCHRYDHETPLEEVCFTMNHLIEKSYIRYWGVSQWSAVQITNAVRICEKNGWRKPISNQPIYNMLNRSLEVDVMDVCEAENIGLLTYSPLSQGLLTGKYTAGSFPKDSRANDKNFNQYFPFKRATENFYEKIEELKLIADSLNISMTKLALAWILRKKPLSSVIVGARTLRQLHENTQASGVIIPENLLEKIETILDNAPIDQYTGQKIGHGVLKRGY